MNKLFTTLAVTGMGAALAVGAQAQTFTPAADPLVMGSNGIYTLNVNEETFTLTPGTLYEYEYLVTLTADSTPTTDVTDISFANIQGLTGTPGVAEGAGLPGVNTVTDFLPQTLGSTINYLATAGSPGGLQVAGSVPTYNFTAVPTGPVENAGNGDSVLFFFDSTLPAASGTVSVSTNGTNPSQTFNGGNLGGNGDVPGPGPAAVTIPETSSFALLGLGLLPLALIARRRITSNQ